MEKIYFGLMTQAKEEILSDIN